MNRRIDERHKRFFSFDWLVSHSLIRSSIHLPVCSPAPQSSHVVGIVTVTQSFSHSVIHPSALTYHASRITYHASRITHHASRITHHASSTSHVQSHFILLTVPSIVLHTRSCTSTSHHFSLHLQFSLSMFFFSLQGTKNKKKKRKKQKKLHLADCRPPSIPHTVFFNSLVVWFYIIIIIIIIILDCRVHHQRAWRARPSSLRGRAQSDRQRPRPWVPW